MQKNAKMYTVLHQQEFDATFSQMLEPLAGPSSCLSILQKTLLVMSYLIVYLVASMQCIHFEYVEGSTEVCDFKHS